MTTEDLAPLQALHPEVRLRLMNTLVKCPKALPDCTTCTEAERYFIEGYNTCLRELVGALAE
ncbi:MAG: hypothetical protein E4H01_08675 [Lysobacterales bacterium]|nr:MAG: hypothetical protein E4H01_08675 [Xanthomonadales bacterium]